MCMSLGCDWFGAVPQMGRTTGKELLSGQHVVATNRLPVVNVVDYSSTHAVTSPTHCQDTPEGSDFKFTSY